MHVNGKENLELTSAWQKGRIEVIVSSDLDDEMLWGIKHLKEFKRIPQGFPNTILDENDEFCFRTTKIKLSNERGPHEDQPEAQHHPKEGYRGKASTSQIQRGSRHRSSRLNEQKSNRPSQHNHRLVQPSIFCPQSRHDQSETSHGLHTSQRIRQKTRSSFPMHSRNTASHTKHSYLLFQTRRRARILPTSIRAKKLIHHYIPTSPR